MHPGTEQRPDLQIEQQFELELTLTGNVAVDLRRIAATTEPDARSVREAAKKLATLLPGANGSPAIPWAEARDILLPRLVSTSFLAEIRNAHEAGGALAARALVGDLHVALVLGYEGRARYVREDEVATWIVGEQGAHDQALANLARRSVAARFSEVLRSGIQAIPRTQLEASVASGLTTFQSYRYVILPVALRLIIPPGTNESLNLLKNSSVALTISVAELTFQTRQIETYTAKAIEALTAGTVIYLVLCVSIATIMAWVERRTAIPGLIAGGHRR